MTQNPKMQKTQICVLYKIAKKQKWKYLPFATFETITYEPIKI